MTAARIVKLVPIGQPEDRMFEEVVVGGTDTDAALADFVGWHLQKFDGLTTDGAGRVSVTLARAPTDLAHCFVLLAEDERLAAPFSLAGSVLTVQKRKLKYDKANAPANTSATGAPAGVTIAAASGQSTGSTTATNQTTTLTGTAATLDAGGSGDALAAGQAHAHTQNAHSHTTDVLYQHGHTLTYTSTSLVAAATEATVLAVLYR